MREFRRVLRVYGRLVLCSTARRPIFQVSSCVCVDLHYVVPTHLPGQSVRASALPGHHHTYTHTYIHTHMHAPK